MATVTLGGNEVHTSGDLPAVGGKAPDFHLTKGDLSDVTQSDFAGKKMVLNIFPSIDTPVCATSVRKFNEAVAKLDNTVVLCISKDLPFALSRFCGAEGLDNVVPLSELRSSDFGTHYGVRIVDGPLAGVLARAVVVTDADGKVVHTELVSEIKNEPNYEAAIAAVE